MHTDILAQSATLGGYIAIWKLVIFVVLFGCWAWIGQWVDKDALAVRTNRQFWNYVYLGVGVGATVVWLLMPTDIFIVQLLVFLVAWLSLSVVYILHRNARVFPNERILTPDHIRFLLSREGKQKEFKRRLVFISANKNELPMPHRHDPEYDGYIMAEDFIYDIWLRRVSVARMVLSGEEVKLIYVIDGFTGSAGDRDRAEMDHAVTYLKAVANLDIKDRRHPQSGMFTTSIDDGDTVQWKIKTAGSTRGEQMVLERVEEVKMLKLDALGLNADQLEAIRPLVERPAGVILCSSEPAMGLTTTLYGMVIEHDAFTQNLNTLEKSILVDLDNVTQHLLEQEDVPDHKSSARRLQSVLRGDPDVVMVGFCDTADMAKVGTQAALEGKKLYFGITAPSTFHALQEWLGMVGDNEKVSQSLLAVLCQRLLRKLCLECRQAYSPDVALLKKLNLPAEKIKQFYRPPTELEYDKHGKPILCPNCQGTGYVGRTAVFETLFVTEALQKLIVEKAPINSMRAQFRKDRMLYLQEQAIRKVIDGTTSIHEVLRAATEKAAKPKSAKPAAAAEEEK